VSSADITNKFVRGQFSATEKGANDANILTGYSAQLYTLPLSVKFDIKIICDNLNKAFKIAEQLLDIYYSNRVMYFQYNGVRIPAQFSFPSTELIDKKYSTFTMNTDNKITISLAVAVETYFPSFEKTSKRKSSNIMEKIGIVKKDSVNNNTLTSGWVDQTTGQDPNI